MDVQPPNRGKSRLVKKFLLTSRARRGDRRGRGGVHLALFQSDGQLPLHGILCWWEGREFAKSDASSRVA